MKTHIKYTGANGTFVVVSSAAQMPSSCWGSYRRVAVLELVPGAETPKMITDRSKSVKRIVETWEKLSVGLTERCAFERATSKASQMAQRLAMGL